MANEVLIEIEVLEKPGRTMADARRELTSDARRIASDIEGVFDRIDLDIDTKVNVDDSEIRQADSAIRDLDSIPPPTIDVDINAKEAVGELENTLGGIDVGNMGDSIVSQLGTALALAGPIGALVGTVGKDFGGALAAGFGRGFSANRNRVLEAVKFGLSGSEMVDVGRAAGSAWGDGFGDSLGELRNTAALLENTLGEVDDSLNLEASTRQAQALSDIFGVEIADSARLARRLVANELAPDTVAAFNLMGAAAQRYRLDQDEIFDVLSEFSPVFGKMGVDGAQAMNIIGEIVQRGLLPNVDRAAELFEEFNIEVTNGGAAEALEEIGLSSAKMQEALASGQGARAMAVLATELLKIEDAAKRNRLAVDIFGASIESAGETDAILGYLATAEAIGEFGTAMADAVAATEATATGFEGAKRKAEDLGAAFGGFLAQKIGQASDDFDGLTDTLGITGDGMDGVASDADLAADAMLKMRNQASDTSLTFDDLTGEVLELDDALSAFSDRFDSDRIFRSINDDVRSLTEATAELTAADFSLTEGFDTTTAAGSRVEAQFERLSGNLDTMIKGFEEGDLTAREFDAGQNAVEVGIRAVAAEMGATAAATQFLIDKYGAVPPEVTTRVIAIDNATQSLQNIVNKIGSIQRNVVVTVTRSFKGFASGGIAAAQDGGARESLVQVNERGPEIAKTPAGNLVELATGSQVFSAEDSERIRSNGGGSGPTVVLNVAGSILTNRDIISIVRDEFQRGGFAGVIPGAAA